MKLSSIIMASLLVLSACGGGSSSSDEATSSTRFDGTYTGTQNVSLTISGVTNSFSTSVTFTVSNGRLVLQNPEGTNTIPINDDGQYSETGVPLDYGEQDSLQNCDLIATQSGSVNPPQLTGTIEASGTCVVDGSNQPTTFTNTYSATRQ